MRNFFKYLSDYYYLYYSYSYKVREGKKERKSVRGLIHMKQEKSQTKEAVEGGARSLAKRILTQLLARSNTVSAWNCLGN